MKKKVYAGIMGLVVGDALGVPFEFKQRDTFKCEGMTGWGTYNQPPGTWSDDSSLTLATLESIGRVGRVDPEDIMKNFSEWYFYNEFTPYREVFDVGRTTRQAIERYRYGTPAIECGGKGEMDNGNGALMRILPLAFIPDATIIECVALASITHAKKSAFACCIYIGFAKLLLEGITTWAAFKEFAENANLGKDDLERLLHVAELTRDEVKSTGYVLDTLEAALWCLLSTDNYKDCVLTAVNLGGDTDTIAAVAGGLAGNTSPHVVIRAAVRDVKPLTTQELINYMRIGCLKWCARAWYE